MRRITIPESRLPWLELLFWIALGASFFVFPDKLNLIAQIMVIGLFAVSLNLALGYAGIITLGHALFFGVGAYTAGLVSKAGWGEPITLMLLAMVICGVLGWVLSFMIVRGSDLTRLMITIAMCVLFAEVANHYSSITGGSDGLQGVSIWPVLGIFDFDLYGRTSFIFAFAVLLVGFAVMRLVLTSPFGLVIRGIHDNQRRMLAIGSPTDARLRLAYTFSAAFAGIAGALLTDITQFVGLDTITFEKSAEVLIVLVLGGTGRLYGGIIGAIIYMWLHDTFSDLSPEYWMLWLGIFLIAVVMIGRGGILGMLASLIRVRRT